MSVQETTLMGLSGLCCRWDRAGRSCRDDLRDSARTGHAGTWRHESAITDMSAARLGDAARDLPTRATTTTSASGRTVVMRDSASFGAASRTVPTGHRPESAGRPPGTDLAGERRPQAWQWQDSPDLNTIEKSTLRLDRILPAVRESLHPLGHERQRVTTPVRARADQTTLWASALMADRAC